MAERSETMRTTRAIKESVGWIYRAALLGVLTMGMYANTGAQSGRQSAHYRSGVELYRQHKFREALEELRLAVEEDSTDALVFFTMGLAHKNLKEYDAALASYERTLRIAPEYVKAYAAMGDMFFLKRDMERARQSYLEAVKVDPTFEAGYRKLSAVHVKIALDLYQRGKFEKAAMAFQKAASFDSSRASTFFNLGATYKKLKRWERAAHAYRQALDVDPTYVEAYLGLGDVQVNMEQHDQARQSYTQAIRHDSTAVKAYRKLGALHIEDKQYGRAIPALLKAVSLAPKDADAHYRLAEAYVKTGLYDGAIAEGRACLQHDEGYTAARVLLGEVYEQLDQKEKAIAEYEKATDDLRWREYARNRIETLTRDEEE